MQKNVEIQDVKTGDLGNRGERWIDVSRRPTRENLVKVPELPGETPAREFMSIPRAAERCGVSASTLYRSIGSDNEDRLKAYYNPNLGSQHPEVVVLLRDVLAYEKTLRANPVREAKLAARKKAESDMGAVAPSVSQTPQNEDSD